LKVDYGAPNTLVRLLGHSNGQSWDIRGWRTTDAGGSFKVDGRFAEGLRGATPFRLRSVECSQTPSPSRFRTNGCDIGWFTGATVLLISLRFRFYI